MMCSQPLAFHKLTATLTVFLTASYPQASLGGGLGGGLPGMMEGSQPLAFDPASLAMLAGAGQGCV